MVPSGLRLSVRSSKTLKDLAPYFRSRLKLLIASGSECYKAISAFSLTCLESSPPVEFSLDE